MANIHPLRAWRILSDLTVTELARKAGTTVHSVSKVELGKQNPSLPLIRALIKATGGALTADDFVFPGGRK